MAAPRRTPGRGTATPRRRAPYASAAVRVVLERHGRFAHHGDPCGVAAEWIAAGFDAAEVDAWLSVHCASPRAAARLAADGWLPTAVPCAPADRGRRSG